MSDEQGSSITRTQIGHLLQRVMQVNLEFIKLESLFMFDGQPGYSLGQEE